MTDLQMGLVALGAIIIVAVIFFNWWQERSLRNEVSQPFTESKRDPLMDEFRLDPDAVPEEKLERAKSIQSSAKTINSTESPASSQMRQPVPEAIEDHPSYTGPVGDAASAVAQFEDDMSVPVQEKEVNALREAYLNENPADELEAASSDELMEEAGLDEDVATPAPAATKEVPLPQEVSLQIDMIALLQSKNAVAGRDIRKFLLTLTDVDKSVYGYGLASDGWQMLTHEQEDAQFSNVLCSLQLVDRAGPVTREALKRFQQAIHDMAKDLGATVEWQGDTDALGYAVELDRFCVDVDKLVGFHLVQGDSGPFTGTKLRGLAEANGMALNADGAFYYRADSGQQQFAMINQDGTAFTQENLRTTLVRGVTFQLDIPHVTNCTEVFNHMVLSARKMANTLGGQLVDANLKPLGEPQLDKIRQELKTIHAKMVARGIIPGSLISHRLFS